MDTRDYELASTWVCWKYQKQTTPQKTIMINKKKVYNIMLTKF